MKNEKQLKRIPVLAAATPDYLPDITWVARLLQAECFVLADDIQFIKSGSMNRGRIKSAAGAQWLTVPVLTGGRGRQLFRDVRIDGERNWQGKHWHTLQVNYAYAPYFEFYADLFEEIYSRQWRFLIDLSQEIIQVLSRILRLATTPLLSSSLPLEGGGNQRIIDLSRQLGYRHYLAGADDRAFLDPAIFQSAGIDLEISEPQTITYRQQFPPFVGGLSFVDLLFNEGPESISRML